VLRNNASIKTGRKYFRLRDKAFMHVEWRMTHVTISPWTNSWLYPRSMIIFIDATSQLVQVGRTSEVVVEACRAVRRGLKDICLGNNMIQQQP
jgi:hypothetical protein